MDSAELRLAFAQEMHRVIYGSAPAETALYGCRGDEPDEEIARLVEWLQGLSSGIGWAELERRGNAPPEAPPTA